MRRFKRNGFSLVELVVSLLVVSIAMLGFASLLAFSSKSIHGNYSKNVGTDKVQAFSMLFQQSRVAFEEANLVDGNAIILDCGANNTIPTNIVSSTIDTFNNSFGALCASAAVIPGVANQEFGFSVTRFADANGALNRYEVMINFAYQTNNNDSRTIVASVANGLIANFCPLNDDRKKESMQTNRINNSIVCNSIEVTL